MPEPCLRTDFVVLEASDEIEGVRSLDRGSRGRADDGGGAGWVEAVIVAIDGQCTQGREGRGSRLWSKRDCGWNGVDEINRLEQIS